MVQPGTRSDVAPSVVRPWRRRLTRLAARLAPLQRSPHDLGVRSEQALLVAIGLISASIATAGLLAVLLESAAADADARYVTESTLVRSGQSQVSSEISAAKAHLGTYRRMMAEAEAVATDDSQRAEELRTVARSYAADHNLTAFLVGTRPATATLDVQTLTEVLQHQFDGFATPPDQPAAALRTANTLHTRARTVEGCATGIAVLLVLLTFARISPTTRGRTVLLVLSTTGYLGLVTTALVAYLGRPR